MFKISRKKIFLRGFAFLSVVVLAISATVALASKQADKEVKAATETADITYSNDELAYYTLNNGVTDTTHYFYATVNGVKVLAFCANPNKDATYGEFSVNTAADSAQFNKIKLLAYIYRARNNVTAATTASNEIFNGWATNDDEVYAYTHATIGYVYDGELMSGFTNYEKDKIERAIALVEGYIANEADVWVLAKQFTLNYTLANSVPGHENQQDMVWIEPNTPKYGSIKIKKCDSKLEDTCTAQGNASLSGITFSVYNNSGSKIYIPVRNAFYNDGALIATGSTDASGEVTFTNLLADNIKYKIVESSTNSSYELTAGEQTTTLSIDGEVKELLFKDDVLTGSITVVKKDSSTNSCATVGNASFSTVRFSITNNSTNPVYYNGASYAKGAVMDTKGVDSNCRATFTGLPYGSYIIKEVAYGTGYQENTIEKEVIIPTNNVVALTAEFVNNPVIGKITVNKTDATTGSCENTAGLSFAGTTIELRNNSTNPIYYNGQSIAKGEVITSKQFSSTDCSVVFENLPYGSYIIKETTAGTGYILDATDRIVTIPTGNSTNVSTSIANSPIRGDVKFVKRDSANNTTLKNVAFRISAIDENNNILESHIVITNQDGVVNTSSSFIPHSTNTNGYDNKPNPIVYAGYGTWFGRDASNNALPVNDNLGALPYGKYLIQELECEANRFCYDIPNQKTTITINKPNQLIDLGDWDNSCVVFSLGTVATDAKDDKKIIEVSKETKIKDTISYCVKKGLNFTVKGILMDKTTGAPLLVDGKTVEEQLSFNSKDECGELEMFFAFDSTELAGREVVVFESLYYDNKLLIQHDNINDKKQTVELVDFHTYANNRATGDKNLPPNEDVEIEDTVYYCLVTGSEYTIKGVLMNKSTKSPVVTDGKTVEQTITITPKKPCGEVKMVYELNTSDLHGVELVIFESLYRGGELLIIHEDYDNADETVIVDVPAPNTGRFTASANGSKSNYLLIGASLFIIMGVGGYLGSRIVARKRFFKKRA